MNSEQLGEDSKSNQFQSVDTPHQSAEAPVYLGELRGFQSLIFCWLVYPAQEQPFHISCYSLSKDFPTKWCEKTTWGVAIQMALLNHQSYHQFLAPQKRSVQVFKFLKFVYQGIRFVGGWWLRCWACWFTKLLLLPMYLSCIFTYILYHRSSCGHPFRIPDFYGFLGLATNMTTHARSVRAGGTNILRQGNKLDRTVLLPEPWRKSTETIEELFFFRYQSFMASQPY